MKKNILPIILWGIFLTSGFLIAYVPLNPTAGIANVMAYGAMGNGATDDTVAVQAAIDSYLPVYFPPGRYILGNLTITNAVLVYGAGPNFQSTNATVLWPNSATNNIFNVNTSGSLTMKDLAMTGNLFYPTAGAGVVLDDLGAQGTANLFSHFDNVIFDQMFTGIKVVRASSYTVKNCVFWNIPTNGFGIFVDNLFNKDQGDPGIGDCTFATAVTNGSVCIAVQGGFGTRIHDNKFLNSPAISINTGLITSNGSAQIYITGNSFDGITSAGPAVNIFNSTSGTNFFGVTIVGNQFNAGALFQGWLFIAANPSGTFQNVTISGNTFQCFGASMTANGGIIVSCATNVTITGNTIIGGGTGNGGGTGIFFNASGIGVISGNTCTNFFRDIVTNSSPNFLISNNWL